MEFSRNIKHPSLKFYLIVNDRTFKFSAKRRDIIVSLIVPSSVCHFSMKAVMNALYRLKIDQ